MATLNQQMDDLLSPDDMMLQGMEEGTFEQAKKDTKEFAKSVVKGSATAPIMVPVDIVDLGVMAPALKDEVKPFFPTYSGIEEAFEQLSAMGFSRKNATKWLADNTGIQLKGDYGEVVGEFISPAAATNTAVKGLKTLASVATKYGNDVPFTISRIEDEAKKLFNTASGGDDLDGMAPAVAGDAPTPTAAADTTELPDTTTTKMMVGEGTEEGRFAVEQYDFLKATDDSIDDAELFARTGVYQGKDGKKRIELDTQDINFKNIKDTDKWTLVNQKTKMKTTLSELMDFPKLFDEYKNADNTFINDSSLPTGALPAGVSPYAALEDIPIYIDKIEDTTGGFYSPSYDSITINIDLLDKPEQFKSTLLHELQHAIQHREGFTQGANWENFYKRASKELGTFLVRNEKEFMRDTQKAHQSLQLAKDSLSSKIAVPLLNADNDLQLVEDLVDIFIEKQKNRKYSEVDINVGKPDFYDISEQDIQNYFSRRKSAIKTASEELTGEVNSARLEGIFNSLDSREMDIGVFLNQFDPPALAEMFKDIVRNQRKVNALDAIEKRAMFNYYRTYGEVESRLVQERYAARQKLKDEGYSKNEIRQIMFDRYPPFEYTIAKKDFPNVETDKEMADVFEPYITGETTSKRPGLRGEDQYTIDERATLSTDETSRVFHLTKKDFDVADVIRSGTDDIGFHVGTAAQATARGSTGKPYDRELMEGMTKGERILPMVLKQNLKPARIPDMSSFKEPRNWLGNLSISTSDLQGMKFLRDEPSDAKLLENAPRVTVDGETRIMMPDAIRAGVDPDLWKDLILEASRARRIGLDTINKQEDRVQWFNTLKATANKHGYDSFVYRNEYEGSDQFNVDALVEQIQRASRGEIDPSEVDVNARFADSYMLLEPDQAKGIFGAMTEGNPAFMKNRGGLI
jgi:hypothetical protein